LVVAEENRSFSREMLVAIPLLGTAVAVAFDVGYFFGLDIHLFGFFSLSEHIVFALQALPLALVAVALLSLSMVSFLKGREEAPSPTTEPKRFRQHQLTRVVLAMVAFTLSYLSLKTYIYQSVMFGFVGIATVVMTIVPRYFWTPVVYVPFLGSGILATSWGVGIDFERWQIEGGDQTHIVRTAEGDIGAKLIHTGERGVLIYDSSHKQVRLLKWDAIKEVIKQK
jgi:hypothetical protein